MAFLEKSNADQIRKNIITDPSLLGKEFRKRRAIYEFQSIEHGLAEHQKKEGWEEYAPPLKTKTKLRRAKTSSAQFIDDIWSQLYKLGYRSLSKQSVLLPYVKATDATQRIDIIAANDETILLIECTAFDQATRAPSLINEFTTLKEKIHGMTQSIEQVLGKGRKVKYIYATRNVRIDSDSSDIEMLLSAGGFFYNDKTHDYISSLIQHYKEAATYQFSALLFKGRSISKDKIKIPAIEGTMGGKKYYMFSIEPHLLLKMGFVLHRTSANENEMPTYQRLLVPNRLKGIRKFINDGGYFPNSIILNFTKGKNKLTFDPVKREDDSRARAGTLNIPNCYAIAYVIDGQHRLYGYAGTPYNVSNTIPAVAFEGLSSVEQLEIFMDINENQKAVSPTLRITLEEDLYWNADRADIRLKALRSSIIRKLADDLGGPLHRKIAIGEDKALLSAKPFANALSKSTLIPKAKGNQYDTNFCLYSPYDTSSKNHTEEMQKTRNHVVKLLNNCYELVEEKFPDLFNHDDGLILSNRGTFPFIGLISSLNEFVTDQEIVSSNSSSSERFTALSKYLLEFLKALKDLPQEDRESMKEKLGGGVETAWLRRFQLLVNQHFPEYNPPELIDWKERQDQVLQDTARALVRSIEKFIKHHVIQNLRNIFDNNWELEIGSIQRDCEKRAKEEMEKHYKEGLDVKKIPWTDMFFITEYKSIIEKYWTKRPSTPNPSFQTFEELFALDVGKGFSSKSDKTKWISIFNSYRNNVAHEGTKEKGLNKEEVLLLQKIHGSLIKS